MTKSKAAYLFATQTLGKEKLYMWTFTFATVLDVKATRKKWNHLLTLLKRRWPKLAGLRVFELHKNHGLHVHLVTNRWIDVNVARDLAFLAGWGRIHVMRIPPERASYLAKYLSKDRPECLKGWRMRKALEEFYPAALEAFEDWTVPAAWSFVQRFPTPAALAKAGKRQWEKFLHTHRLYRPETAQRRIEIFSKALALTASEPLTQAKSRLALTRAKQLLLLQRELDEYREKIERLFAQHPDHELFGSLPGAGAKLAPRLLGEIGQDRSVFDSAQSLQCYAGTAPISFQSGQLRKAHIRWSCNRTLRSTVHLWADHSRLNCGWAQTYYKAARERGKSHACALRCLGQRWLKILWKMWQTHTLYNAELHAQNQLAHGSWLLQVKAS